MLKAIRRSTGIALIAFGTLGVSSIQSLEAADYTAELAAVAALGDLTTAPAIYTDDSTPGTAATLAAGDLKTIYFDALDYLGNPTRAYAWVGIPAGASPASKVPGVVLVHGGGGTAYQSWVQKWNARGYAAISIAVEGQTDATTPPVMNTGWHIHNMPGPVRAGIYNDTNVSPITNQWMYHAVADTVLANSLLRSLPEVDADKVGLMGVSWGGVITSTTIGIDDRFKFAIPTYGCGHLYDARNTYGVALGSKELYKQVWDPMVWIANATMPVLWFSWPQDAHFPMENLAYTYHAAAGERMVSLVPGMGHGHGPAWSRPESYDFADSVVGSDAPWCVQQSLDLVGNSATVTFDSIKALNSASLVYRTSNRPKISNVAAESPDPWTVAALSAPVEGPAGTWTVTATMPAGVTGWFVNVEATGVPGNPYGYVDSNLIASSDYQENISLTLTPGGGLSIDHPLTQSQSTGSMNVAFIGPGNLEVVDIQITEQSHPGAFTHLATLPLIVDNPTPASASLQIQFDNTVAALTSGQLATGTVKVVWENLDGSTAEATLPVSATALAPMPVIYDTTADWSSKAVNSLNDVIIRNGATVTLDPPTLSNLIVNGSFETPDVAADGDPSPNGFASYGVGNNSVTGWTISGNSLFLIDGFDNFNADLNAVASDGSQFAQLQYNSSASTISQTISTEVGQVYELQFDYGGIDFTNSRNVTLIYNFGGADQTIDYSLLDLNTGQVPWVNESVTFTATNTSTTISFTGDFLSGFWGPSVDKVSVRPTQVGTLEANTITVNDDASPITATLAIEQNLTLAASTAIRLGAGTGAGIVNQTTGAVTTADLTINASGTGDHSHYNLSGGTVFVTDALSVNDAGVFNLTGGNLMLSEDGVAKVKTGGLLNIDGGSLIKDFNGSTSSGTLGFSGDDGTILVRSGALQLLNGTVHAVVDLRSMLEISGGDVDMVAQTRLRGELKVLGDAASIDIGWLGTFAGSGLVFEFDGADVSPINVAGWMGLADASLTVDGSAYTGGADTFTLLNSTHLASTLDPANITITGFTELGLNAIVEQDELVEEWVQLVVTVNPYGTWALGYSLSGPDATVLADPDGDGMKNLMEFALGGDPTNGSDRGTLPTLEDNASVMEFTYLRRVNPASQGLAYTVKTKTDLSSDWGTDGLGASLITPTDPVSEFERVTTPVSTSAIRRFVRLEIETVE